jgi:hypothetical protein
MTRATETGRSFTVFSHTARTASENSATFYTPGARGVDLHIRSTALTLTPSVVFTVKGYNATRAEYYTILASAAVTTNSADVVLRIGPGLTAAANTVANFGLPDEWRVEAVAADTDSLTYSIHANLTG